MKLAGLLVDELGPVKARRHQRGQLAGTTTRVGQDPQHHADVLAIATAQQVKVGV